MTDKQTEALKLALEALNSFPTKHLTPFIISARTAIREALAEPSEALASEASEDSSGTEQPDVSTVTNSLSRDAEQPAQPQQEPVAEWGEGRSEPKRILWKPGYVVAAKVGDKLYAAPPAQRKPWVGLTDEEIERCMKQAYATVQGRNLERAFAHAIEAKLREKNGIKGDA